MSVTVDFSWVKATMNKFSIVKNSVTIIKLT